MVIYYAAVETARFELRCERTENIMGKSRVMGSIPRKEQVQRFQDGQTQANRMSAWLEPAEYKEQVRD